MLKGAKWEQRGWCGPGVRHGEWQAEWGAGGPPSEEDTNWQQQPVLAPWESGPVWPDFPFSKRSLKSGFYMKSPNFFIYLFIYFWLCWVFVSVQGLSLVAASGGHSSSWCAGLSLSRPLLLRSTSSRRAGSVVVAHGPRCSAACGIFPDQGPNTCPLHWQADSQPLRHQGSPEISQLLWELIQIFLEKTWCSLENWHPQSTVRQELLFPTPRVSCGKNFTWTTPNPPSFPSDWSVSRKERGLLS